MAISLLRERVAQDDHLSGKELFVRFAVPAFFLDSCQFVSLALVILILMVQV